MLNITHLTKPELEAELVRLGEKPFRTKQIWSWIYTHGVRNFDEMTNISKSTRETLTQNFNIQRPEITKDILSKDGTRKWLIKFSDCKEVEMVYIPEVSRATLCISSQVGCTLACKFCHTGTQTLVRNLEFHEIIAQILVAKDLIGNDKDANNNDWDPKERKLTNIVFMGMGEPLFNYDNVAKAVHILADDCGLNISKRKITISTSGLVPEILKCAEELKTNLAISLHATNDKLRTDIMAINKKYPLKDLLQACKKYGDVVNQKITFEYVMLDGINDQEEHAHELIYIIKKYNVNAKINLIPFNPWDGCDYKRTDIYKITQFQEILKSSFLISTIRKTRGDDVLAACGQLKSASQRMKKARRSKFVK